jgi:hypothetical protein
MTTDNNNRAPQASESNEEAAAQDAHLSPEALARGDEHWSAHRACIWQSQDEFLKHRFGEQFDWANYGWGSCQTSDGAAESTKFSAGRRIYILSSWSRSDNPALVTHELLEC